MLLSAGLRHRQNIMYGGGINIIIVLLSAGLRHWQNIVVVVLTLRNYAYGQSCCGMTCAGVLAGICY